MSRPLVLCVDDESQVVEGLRLHLRRHYTVHLALSGSAALKTMEERGPFAVVISDMRMAPMDGRAFLAAARKKHPETVRLLLTGQADLDVAVAAINEGRVFRFLTKPCPPDRLLEAVDAAAEQSRLILAERELLEETLHGSVAALVDILALASPARFGRAQRVKKLAGRLARALKLPEPWRIEVAAMLTNLAYITLPDATNERLRRGERLEPAEREMVGALPATTKRLLGHIPRLDPVVAIIEARGGRKPTATSSTRRAARVLDVAADFDLLEQRGLSPEAALGALQQRPDRFDPKVVGALGVLLGCLRGPPKLGDCLALAASALKVGMVLEEDITTSAGVLFAAKGYEVTASFVDRVHNLPARFLQEPVFVSRQGR